ncbi:MAG: hypothetical protein HN411_01815 [Waddliaceae bacterium]|nr:hypothetical protein [Waddliaceae bacterium]MBT3579246.1 hypothetical protein [Waddliaceae bacterium]MBT4444265.1 hypothetical protein [Waddliaceae bacterium]MBT6929221.1 hypothetical protein [Waddliaceae bacterium]MBT7264761.1 hypothetical protein [Waddliaceae bacterium]
MKFLLRIGIIIVGMVMLVGCSHGGRDVTNYSDDTMHLKYYDPTPIEL